MRWLPNPLLPLLAATTGLVLLCLYHDVDWGPINWAVARAVANRPLLAPLVTACTFVSLPLVVRFVRSGAPRWRRLAVLIVLGGALQWSFAYAQGRGPRQMYDRVWSTGHTEFLNIAKSQDLDGLIGDYEDLARQRHWVFPHSKPPGTLYAYRAVVAIARTPIGDLMASVVLGHVGPDPVGAEKDRIAGAMFLLLTLFTFLTVIPLHALTRRLADERAADLAALLYVVTPSVILVLMAMDGALYPLVGCAAAAIGLVGAQRRRWWIVALAGVVSSLGLFVSFSLLAVTPIAAALPVGNALLDESEALRPRLLRAAQYGALFLAGLVVPHLLLVVFAHYHVLVRYDDAALFHKNWMTISHGKNWVLGSMVQFLTWLGMPIACAFVAGAVRPQRWRALLTGAVLLTLALLIVTDVIGHARNEAMRLWLVWVPFLCVGAGARLARWEERSRWVVPVVLALQLVTAFFIQSGWDV